MLLLNIDLVYFGAFKGVFDDGRLCGRVGVGVGVGVGAVNDVGDVLGFGVDMTSVGAVDIGAGAGGWILV